MILFILNLAILLCNLYSLGASYKKFEVIDEKLDDMAMMEKRISHLCDNLDSVF